MNEWMIDWMNQNGDLVEWYSQIKSKALLQNPGPMPLCPPQLQNGLVWDRTQDSSVGGEQLTAWAMALPWLRVTWSHV
jgi:hypothetical protein